LTWAPIRISFHEVSLALEGYKPIKKIIDVEKGGKLTLDETFTH
jgi:hypothetical protein